MLPDRTSLVKRWIRLHLPTCSYAGSAQIDDIGVRRGRQVLRTTFHCAGSGACHLPGGSDGCVRQGMIPDDLASCSRSFPPIKKGQATIVVTGGYFATDGPSRLDLYSLRLRATPEPPPQPGAPLPRSLSDSTKNQKDSPVRTCTKPCEPLYSSKRWESACGEDVPEQDALSPGVMPSSQRGSVRISSATPSAQTT